MAYASNHKASNSVIFHEGSESTVGTALASDGTYNRLNVESFNIPIRSHGYSVSAPKSGLFTTTTDQSKHDGFGQTYSIDAQYKLTALSATRACASVLESASATATLSSGYTFPQANYVHGAGSAKTQTIALDMAGPGATNDTMVYTGCVGTGMTITGDVGTDGGELKCAVNYMTGYAPVAGNYAFDGTINNEAGSAYNVRDNIIAHTDVLGQDVRLTSFELSISRPIEKIGFQDASTHNFDGWGYAMTGPFEVTGSVNVMFDTSVELFIANLHNSTAGTITFGSGTSAGDYKITLANCLTGEVSVDNGGPALMATIPFTCNGASDLTGSTAFVTFDFS